MLSFKRAVIAIVIGCIGALSFAEASKVLIEINTHLNAFIQETQGNSHSVWAEQGQLTDTEYVLPMYELWDCPNKQFCLLDVPMDSLNAEAAIRAAVWRIAFVEYIRGVAMITNRTITLTK